MSDKNEKLICEWREMCNKLLGEALHNDYDQTAITAAILLLAKKSEYAAVSTIDNVTQGICGIAEALCGFNEVADELKVIHKQLAELNKKIEPIKVLHEVKDIN